MKGKEAWWIVLFIFLLPMMAVSKVGSIAKHSNMDDGQRSRRRTNILGMLVLGIFVFAIFVTQGAKWFRNSQDEKITKNMLDHVAECFANDDRETIKQWGMGGYQDPWGNQIVVADSPSGVYAFLSKGPDGEEGTDDDVLSNSYTRPVKTVKSIVVLPKKPNPKQQKAASTLDKAKGWLKNKWNGDKDVEEDSDK